MAEVSPSCVTEHGADADDRRWSPRTRFGCSRRCASSASTCARTCMARAAQGDARLRRAALRGHRRGHQLGQVPCRRAARGRRVATVVDRADVTRLGEGLERAGRLGAEPMRRTVEAIAAWRTKPRASARRRSRRSAPPGSGSRRTGRSSSTPCEAAAGSRSRSSPAKRRPDSHTSPRRAGLQLASGSLAVFDTGGGSSQFTFGEAERSTSVQRERRRGSVHRAIRPRRGRRRRDARRGARRHRERSLAARRTRADRRARRDGRSRDEPRRGQASGSRLRRRPGPGNDPRSREIDRQIELYRARTPTQRRSSSAYSPPAPR